MKKLFLLSVSSMLIALGACTNLPKDQYVITGTIEGMDKGKVYLSNSFMSDTAEVMPGGKFEFKGALTDPLLVNFTVDGVEDGVSFFVEPAQMALTLKKDSIAGYKLTGSKTQDAFIAYQNNVVAPIFSGQNVTSQEQFQSLLKAKWTADLKYAAEDTVTIIPVTIIIPIVIRENEIGKARELFNGMSAQVKSNPHAVQLDKDIAAREAVEVGAIAPEFTQNDPEGKPVSLSSFKGQYVLIDFWSSWCGPCRRENPNVVAAYQKYKDKNFTVLGVSLDDNKEQWLSAIKDDKLTWTQVSDLGGWGNVVAKQYMIRSIPQNVLLDPEGRIIAKNLRGEALGEKLAEILK